MSTRFASAKNALGVCDVCGFTYKLRDLRSLYVKGRDTNVQACQECWSPDHPQNKLGEFPVSDPQAIRNPRPDSGQYAQSRASVQPITPVVAGAFLGTVTVTTGT